MAGPIVLTHLVFRASRGLLGRKWGGGRLKVLQAGDPHRVGAYRLIGLLGGGGMGRVFLGRSPGGRLVAVKVIRAELADNPDFRTRFGREVAAARKVNGLFTALVVDADVEGPAPWLATAYVAGPSLAEAVTAHGPLAAGPVVALAAGLAEGLGAVHAAGVVHRDLKPSNVLLAEDGPRVIDFGISRAVEASALTHTGQVVGSPGFMSPEQAEGREVGPASDVFSLGAVLVFAANGEGPFGTGSTPALVYRVVHADPGLDGVPEQIRDVVAQCLAKDPALRPTTAQLLAGLETDVAGWLPASVFQEYSPEALAAGSTPGAPVPPSAGDAAAPGSPLAADAPAGPPTVTAATAYWTPDLAAAQAGADPLAGGVAGPAVPAAAKTDPMGGTSPGHPRRRRPGWEWITGLAVCAAAVGIGATWLIQNPSPSATPSPPTVRSHPPSPTSPPASPTPAPTPTTGHLARDQLQPGDCLRGSNLRLNTSSPWPSLATAVPCNEKHTAEIFYSGNSWASWSQYPGYKVAGRQANRVCTKEFRKYIGITLQASIFSYVDVVPKSSEWNSGDTSMQCVVYKPTSQHPAGAPLYSSIKGSDE
jgi:eukaryotic-like serine/threonine-protein kinase